MENDKKHPIDKEGVLLSLGAVVAGTIIYTLFELIVSKGQIKNTTIYRIPTELPENLSMLIDERDWFPSKEDKICDKLRDKVSTSYNMRTNYIVKEKPDLISLFSYLNTLNGADGAVMVEYEQNMCEYHGTSKASRRLESSISSFEKTIKENYPQISNYRDLLYPLRKRS